MAVFPSGPLGFYGSTSDDAHAQPNASSKCSAVNFLSILPSRNHHIQYHLKELAYQLNYGLNSIGGRISLEHLSRIFEGTEFTDEAGNWNELDSPPLNLFVDDAGSTNMTETRSFIQWYIEKCELSNPRITRSVIKSDRKRVGLADQRFPNASRICGAITAAAKQHKFGHLSGCTTRNFSEILEISYNKKDRKVSEHFFTQVVSLLTGCIGYISCSMYRFRRRASFD